MSQSIENLIQEGDASAEKAEFLAASINYIEALRLAQKVGDSKRIKELKQKVVKVSKLIDFSTIHTEGKIPTILLDSFIDSIVIEADELSLDLMRIGHHPYLYPKINHVKEISQKSIPVTYHIANVTTYSEDGHVLNSGEDPLAVWTAQMYVMNQEFIAHLYLSRLFDRMKEGKGLNTENFMSYLKNRGTFSENSLSLLKVGVSRYFENDYISSLHILVPQFESSFLYFSEKRGVDVVALNTGLGISTRTKTLSERYLSTDEFINVWGKDLCEQIKYVLFEPLGIKLRHKVAHGEIKEAECNKTSVETMLYLFLVLAGRVEITKPI